MQQRQVYFGVDIARFIAALLVVGYHLGYKSWSLDHYLLNTELGAPAALQPWSGFTWFGWVGVQIFFVISGFVIAFSSERATSVSFLIGRITRLAPVMWLSILICLPVGVALHQYGAVQALLLAAKSAVFWLFGPWIAGQIWTLGIEIMFYGVIFVLVATARFKRLDLVVLGMAIASLVYWSVFSAGLYEEHSGRLTALLLLQHGCYFALGCALWLCTKKGMTPMNLAIILVAILPAWVQIKSTLIAEAPGYGLEAQPFVPFVVWVALIAAMALSIACNEALTRALSGRANIIRTLGLMTYPLYLIHFHVGGGLMVVLYRHGVGAETTILAGIAASLAVSFVIAVWLERPLANTVKRTLYAVLPAWASQSARPLDAPRPRR